MLQQLNYQGQARPITFFSCTLNDAEKRYSTIEKEELAVIYGLQANRPLCLGYHIQIHTDRPLVWLLKVASPNGRIARWQMLLSEYDFTVQHLAGKENVVADFLSWMKALKEEEAEFEDPSDSVMIVHGPTDENIPVDWDISVIKVLQEKQEILKIVKDLLQKNCTVQEIRRKLKEKGSTTKLPLNDFVVFCCMVEMNAG